MKKWIVISLTVVSLSFIALNGYLIAKKDSKIQHTVYVDNWTRVKKDDVVQTFETEGIIMPQEEYDVYFHDRDKEFQRFLVKEGDEVTAGTPLFEYTTPELDKLRETLELERQQTEGEIAGIDIYISKLLDYQSSISSTPSYFEPDFTLEEDLNINEDASSDVMIHTIEQEIYKQELEKSKLEEKVKKYDSQLSSIDEQSSSVMMVSETDGIVKKVNEKLGNPVITITSNVKVIEGQLTENQFNLAETGMLFTANVAGKKLEGTLGKINSYPVNEPKIDEENHYHFEAIMTEQPEPLAIGSKADISVVTAEAIGIPTIPEKAIYNIKNPYVYLLNENSRIKKQSVQMGLSFEGIQEMTKGVQIREVLMVSPHQAHQNNAYFVTEMKPNRLTKSAIEDLSKHEIWEFFLIGLIEK
ncbi:efflux RND transporter periplasmic adaptor subunit [Metabacillus litoralis]|jgi:HlyD family secretion protein|uniref:efflux RND transporter periplasmic adaptor subunit n=1 Tax=Metabacillus litoralis TaxID=152268 RepID=UPI002041225D|nr:efflux RND transporter periplasmic adaptor subunit [Metabacillus litoralis]MCM3652856.1 efflux RND transporter periplasmic adaptor subunit [Metabacillus litoralis]